MHVKTEISTQIQLTKGEHRNDLVIWLKFSGRTEWLKALKTLKNIKFSSTHRLWYLPYTKESYYAFVALEIPYTHTGKHAEEKASEKNPDSSHAITNISTSKQSGESVSPLAGKEVADIQSNIKIDWTGKGFVITIPYKAADIAKIKTLDGAYWHQGFKKWMAKNTIKNLEKIQANWGVWQESDYNKWYERVMLSHNPCKVELYTSLKQKDKVCVKLIGYGANHQIIRTIPHQIYQSDEKVYLVSNNRITIERIVKAYQDIGYPIENRLAGFYETDKQEQKTDASRVSYFLKKAPSKYYSTLKNYMDTMLSQRYSIHSIIDYTGSMIKLLDQSQIVDMEDLKVSDVNNYLKILANQSVSYSLLNTVHSAVNVFFDRVSTKSWEGLDKLVRPKSPKTLPQILSEGEIIRLIQEIDNIKHLSIVYILYGTGIRRNELINIKIEDVYWERGQIFIRGGKGAKDRVVNISEASKETLETYFHKEKPMTYLFEGRKVGKQYSVSSLASILKKAAKKANIDKKVTPHILRHSFATHNMDAGVALPKIQALLGHSDIKTTMIYTHLSNDDIRNIKSPLDKLIKKVNSRNEK